MILVFLHVAFMLCIGFIWYQAVGEYGGVAGPEAHLAWNLVRFFDFPIFWLCDWGIYAALKSESHAVESILEWILGDDPFRNIEIRLYLPLLLILGSVQWIIVGLSVKWIKGLIYTRSGKPMKSPKGD